MITVLDATFSFDSNTKFEDTQEIPMNIDEINTLISTIDSMPTLVNIEYQAGSDITTLIKFE